MKLLKKSFAWILVLCICVSLSPGGVSAATKIDSEPMDNASILADRAVEYVTRYVENAYLYEDHDLAVGTIRSVAAYTDHAAISGQERLSLNGETFSVAELCKHVRGFEDMATYYRCTCTISPGCLRKRCLTASGSSGTPSPPMWRTPSSSSVRLRRRGSASCWKGSWAR